MWEVYLTDEVDRWLDELADRDAGSHRQTVFAIEALVEGGPSLGRPLVDRIKGSSIHNLKELRPGSSGGYPGLFRGDRGIGSGRVRLSQHVMTSRRHLAIDTRRSGSLGG
jgi:Phage derived protein Gp49-like (DUF891)